MDRTTINRYILGLKTTSAYWLGPMVLLVYTADNLLVSE